MSDVRVHISVSADGYIGGPNQSLDTPKASTDADEATVQSASPAALSDPPEAVIGRMMPS